MGPRVQLFEQIRRESRIEGLSVRALAKRHHVHRRTVRQALASALPPEPSPRVWQSRKIASVYGCDRRDADGGRRGTPQATSHGPPNPRQTGRRAWGTRVVVVKRAGLRARPTSTDRRRSRTRHRSIRPAGTRNQMPHVHFPALSLGKSCAPGVFDARTGSVLRGPHRRVRRDRRYPDPSHPLRQFDQCGAESDLWSSRGRVENPRVLFHSHFGFDPFYCQPGIAGAHGKGGMEGAVGRFRRNRLSPMPGCRLPR